MSYQIHGRWLIGDGPGFLCVAPIPLSADRPRLLDVKENAKAAIRLLVMDVSVDFDFSDPSKLTTTYWVEKPEVGSE